jgi:integrase/recombinase XerD
LALAVSVVTFADAARAHANSRGMPGTRKLYNANLDRWLKWCQTAKVNPTKLTLAEAVRFRDELAENVSSGTVRLTLAILSSMYENAVDASGKPIVSWNPFKKKLPRPKAPDYGKTEAVSSDVAEAVFAAASACETLGARDLAVLLLMYETGQRISSAAGFERKNIFYRDGVMFLWIKVKGGKDVAIPVPERATRAIQTWLDVAPEDKRVFPGLTTRAMNKRLDVYTKVVGVQHVHPHQFRAAYITEALNAGVPLHEVQLSVQHQDPKTTQRYDRGVRGEGVAAAVAKYREERRK